MVAAYLTNPKIILASGSTVVVARWDAVVFDLDGTLVDTAPDLHAHLNEMLADLGRPGFALDEVRPMIGDGARMLLRRGLDASGGMPAGVDLEALFAEFLRRYTARPLRFGATFDGVERRLAGARSGRHQARHLHQQAAGADRPAARRARPRPPFSGGDRRRQPARCASPIPVIFRRCSTGWRPAGRAVLVGDSENDVGQPRRPACPACWSASATPRRRRARSARHG